MADPNTPKEDEATAKLAQVSKDIWNIVPNIVDLVRLQYVLCPYVMRMPVVNYQFQSLQTDTHGFRCSLTDNGVVSFGQFRYAAGPKRVLLCDSTILEYGVSNGEIPQAQWSGHSTNAALWYSFSLPVAHIFQSLLLLELFIPANTNFVSIVVSTAGPVINLLSPFDTKPYPTLFSQSTDAKPNARAFTALTKSRFTLASGVKVNEAQVAFPTAFGNVRKHSLDDRASSRRDCSAVTVMVQTGPTLDWQTIATAETLGHEFIRAKTLTPHRLSIG
jgi:hypothetical protein